MKNLISVCALSVLLFASLARARRVEIWEYDRLFKEADVVVIAMAKETTDSDEPSTDEQWKGGGIAQHTVFDVVSTIKGKVNDGPLTVLHFRHKDGVLVVNGPSLIKFKTKGIRIEGKSILVMTGVPQYLMFLKKTDKEIFEPVTGQYDSSVSFKEIYDPLPDSLEKK